MDRFRPISPRHDFETIKLAFNRWRAESAPHLTRDEAVRFALGQWLIQKGYLPPDVETGGLSRTPQRIQLAADTE